MNKKAKKKVMVYCMGNGLCLFEHGGQQVRIQLSIREEGYTYPWDTELTQLVPARLLGHMIAYVVERPLEELQIFVTFPNGGAA